MVSRAIWVEVEQITRTHGQLGQQASHRRDVLGGGECLNLNERGDGWEGGGGSALMCASHENRTLTPLNIERKRRVESPREDYSEMHDQLHTREPIQ